MHKINFENTIYIKKRSGYANDELNRYLCEWDVSLQRSIMKNRINLKLSAIDVFRQYKAITYVTNERGIRETRAVSIPSYVLFSLSYRFNKNPEKKMWFFCTKYTVTCNNLSFASGFTGVDFVKWNSCIDYFALMYIWS